MEVVSSLVGDYDNPETEGFDEYLRLAGAPMLVASAVDTLFRKSPMQFAATEGGMTITMPGMIASQVIELKFGEFVDNKAPNGMPLKLKLLDATEEGLEVEGELPPDKAPLMPYKITISKPNDGVVYYKVIAGGKPVVMSKKLVKKV